MLYLIPNSRNTTTSEMIWNKGFPSQKNCNSVSTYPFVNFMNDQSITSNNQLVNLRFLVFQFSVAEEKYNKTVFTPISKRHFIFYRLFQAISLSTVVPSEGKWVSKLWLAKWCFKSQGAKTWPQVAQMTYGSAAAVPPLSLISDLWTFRSCCCLVISGRRQMSSGKRAEKQSSPITSRQFCFKKKKKEKTITAD